MKFLRSFRFWIALGVLAALVEVLVIPRVLGGTTASVEAEVYPPVVLGLPVNEPQVQKLSFSGHLKPADTTTVVSKAAGKILSILVKEGQKVAEGQLLGRLDDDVARLQAEQSAAAYDAAQAQLQKVNTAVRPEELSNAKATVAQAEEDLANAKTNLDRTKNLFDSGTLPKSKYEEAQNKVKSAETSVQNAQRSLALMVEGARSEDIRMARAQARAQGKQLELARLQQNYAQIRAPISGRVAVLHVERGNTLGPGSPFATIVSDSDIFASVMVPEPYYSSFYTDPDGFTVNVAPIAWKDHAPFAGKVTEVSSIIDGASRSFEVTIAVGNAQRLLKPGMFADVQFERRTPEPVLQVPELALLNRDGKTVLFVAAAGSANVRSVKMVTVAVGTKGNGLVQVLSGLDPEQEVVVEGNTFLEDGQKVAVVTKS
jgi:RND family efflux transporter MFP subunit